MVARGELAASGKRGSRVSRAHSESRLYTLLHEREHAHKTEYRGKSEAELLSRTVRSLVGICTVELSNSEAPLLQIA